MAYNTVWRYKFCTFRYVYFLNNLIAFNFFVCRFVYYAVGKFAQCVNWSFSDIFVFKYNFNFYIFYISVNRNLSFFWAEIRSQFFF